MKRILTSVLSSIMLFTLLAACGNNETPGTTGSTPAPSGSSTTSNETDGTDGTTDESTDDTTAPPSGNGELVDGKFVETRQITVEVYDRGNEVSTPPEDNMYTDFIKEGMLRDHNVEVTFVPVPRWTEVEELNNLLAAGDAPDVSVTYSYPTILTYANLGGVTDLAPLIEEHKALLPDLFDLLTEDNIYWNRDPEKGTLWALEARLALNPAKNLFIREDWLNQLELDEPSTLEEFEEVLVAFRDNAETLLGENASQMVPFSVSYDVGWRIFQLASSFVPNDLSDKDFYVYGFDDRQLLLPGFKEALRKVNQWYNDGLMWDDFAIYGPGDLTESNMMKAGYVGSYMQNWDDPYRNGEDSIHNGLKRLVGDDAAYIAVETFKNDAGEYKDLLSAPVDRKVFFPNTNDEPLASLLYLNWLSKLDNRMYLQIGEEGHTHEVTENGTIKTIAATDEYIMNSPSNIDYTIVINGLDLGDREKTLAAVALGYSNVDESYITRAFREAGPEDRVNKNANAGEIAAEAGIGAALNEKRDAILAQAVVAPVDQFDSVFDAGLNDYLSSGGQAIIDERTAAWEAIYGSETMLP